MIIQLGAYKILYEEHFPEKVHQCGIIKVEKKSPKYTLIPIPPIIFGVVSGGCHCNLTNFNVIIII